MTLLVSKDLLFVNLSPFMYMWEGMRPTSTMITVCHLKLAQNGCVQPDEAAACGAGLALLLLPVGVVPGTPR